ncbi:MAG: calcium/proton exchanger [Acidimicrobiales bacterium]
MVVSWAADAAGWREATFLTAAAAVIPLAALLGRATEELTRHSGPRIGGLLNATFGNAAELIIGVALVARGEVAIVRASLTGSILGNLLLVLGAAFFAGGLRHRELRFSSRAASTHVVTMALAVAGLLMLSFYAQSQHSTEHRIEVVSGAVAAILVIVYIAGLVFSQVTHADPFGEDPTPPEAGGRGWSLRRAAIVLAVVGVVVAVESELLAGAVEQAVSALGVSRLWLGLILVPIVGNAAEHATAVIVARKGKADLALEIAAGSSAQIALLVTPLLVMVGALVGHPLVLVFSPFELGALALAVALVALISLDGSTNWLEGAQLLALYAILASTSFYLGRP